MIRLIEAKVYLTQNGERWVGTGYWNPDDVSPGSTYALLVKCATLAFERSWKQYVAPHLFSGPTTFLRAYCHPIACEGWGETHYRDYLADVSPKDPVRVTWKKIEGEDLRRSQEGQSNG